MNRILVYVLTASALALVFIFDLQTPRGLAAGMLYMPCILLTAFTSRFVVTAITAAIATVLAIIGFYFSPTETTLAYVAITNRFISIAGAWVLVLLVFLLQKAARRAQDYGKRLDALFRYASEGILILRADGTIEAMNPALMKILGSGSRQLIGAHYSAVVPGGAAAADNLHLAEKEGYSGKLMHLQLKRSDGSLLPATVHFWEFEFQGERRFIAYVMDLTEEMRQAEILNRTNQQLVTKSAQLEILNHVLEKRVSERTVELEVRLRQLRELNAMLRKEMIAREDAKAAEHRLDLMLKGIMENYPNGLIGILDRKLQFVYVRGQHVIKQMWNDTIDASDLIPLSATTPAGDIGDLFRRGFEGERATFEFADPSENKWYLANIVPIGNDGKIERVLFVSQDITHQKEAEITTKKALTKERDLNEMKSRFVSTASHEFRTPLTAIASSASLLSVYTKEEDEPKRAKHLNRIHASVKNLTEILNDFLSLEKIEEGKVNQHRELFDIRELCEELHEEFSLVLKTGQRLTCSYTLTSPMVYLDKHLLRNVLTNLVSNALKYSPDNSEVKIRVENNNGMLKLCVADEGIGIPEDDQKNLFQTFFRASNVDNIKGTGMGLHIVKKYVEIMGGSIEFKSRENEGSEFAVRFVA